MCTNFLTAVLPTTSITEYHWQGQRSALRLSGDCSCRTALTPSWQLHKHLVSSSAMNMSGLTPPQLHATGKDSLEASDAFPALNTSNPPQAKLLLASSTRPKHKAHAQLPVHHLTKTQQPHEPHAAKLRVNRPAQNLPKSQPATRQLLLASSTRPRHMPQYHMTGTCSTAAPDPTRSKINGRLIGQPPMLPAR